MQKHVVSSIVCTRLVQKWSQHELFACGNAVVAAKVVLGKLAFAPFLWHILRRQFRLRRTLGTMTGGVVFIKSPWSRIRLHRLHVVLLRNQLSLLRKNESADFAEHERGRF